MRRLLFIIFLLSFLVNCDLKINSPFVIEDDDILSYVKQGRMKQETKDQIIEYFEMNETEDIEEIEIE